MKKPLLFLFFIIVLIPDICAQNSGLLQFSIDGTAENEWDNYKKDTVSHILESTGYTGKADISGYFQMAWDDSALYLMVTVTDDILFNTNSTSWQNDNLELYFDRKNFKPKSYNGNNFQLSLVRNETAKTGFYSNSIPIQGLLQDSIQYALKNNASGYIAEFRLSWKALGYSKADFPKEGSLLGLDLVLTDNDGGIRDAIIAWNTANEYNTYESPSVWGSIELFGNHNAGKAIHMDVFPPSIPKNLSYSIRDNNIVLYWNTSTDNTALSEYHLYNEYLNLISTVKDTFFIIPYNSLNEYNFVVSALDAFGNESDISNSVTIKSTSQVILKGQNAPVYLTGSYIVLPDNTESISIFNIMGQEMATYYQPENKVDASFLNKGIYIVKIKPFRFKEYTIKLNLP